LAGWTEALRVVLGWAQYLDFSKLTECAAWTESLQVVLERDACSVFLQILTGYSAWSEIFAFMMEQASISELVPKLAHHAAGI
jgi:hypothetical protein